MRQADSPLRAPRIAPRGVQSALQRVSDITRPYFRIDELMRELPNPKLHGIRTHLPPVRKLGRTGQDFAGSCRL